MNEIKDFSRVIAELEDGQFNADCSANSALQKTLPKPVKDLAS